MLFRSDVGHFGQIGTLAAQQLTHGAVAFGEQVNILVRHSYIPLSFSFKSVYISLKILHIWMISILAKTVYHIPRKKANIFRLFVYIFVIFGRENKTGWGNSLVADTWFSVGDSSRK